MAPPSLSTYQQQANAIYQPQQASEAATLANTEQTTQNTLESSKGQVNTDYQSAIDALTATTNSNVGKINQLYTERLGGNFSGLQGNDLGGMFAKADQSQATIESTRANKLADIATSETNAQLTYNTDLNNLTSKYQGLEENYANTNYDSAVKSYDSDQLAQERIDISAAKAAAGSTSSNNAAALAQLNSIYQSKFTAKGAQGKDSYVSPSTYNNLLQSYQEAGGTAAQFKAAFSGYTNPNQKVVNPNDLYNF